MTFAWCFFKALHFVTERLVSSSVIREEFPACCNQGAISLPSLPQPPTTLSIDLNEQSPKARRVQEPAELYKSVPLMGSFSAGWVTTDPCSLTFSHTMTIHDHIYRYIGALCRPSNMWPLFLLVFIHDTDLCRKQNQGWTSCLPFELISCKNLRQGFMLLIYKFSFSFLYHSV